MELKIKTTADYKKISLDETFKFLEATESGLNDAVVKDRLKIFGHNKIEEKKKNPILEFVRRFWGPMPWLLELAMALSFFLGHDIEGIIIFVLLTVNAIIGFMHSRGSQKAVELLKQRLAIRAKVLRNNDWTMVESSEIVPGDIIVVKLGDIIPADAKIISGDLSVDESALTGESLPVDSQALDVIYSGSVVRRGEARCIVINTGANTYFGRTAELVKIAKPKSHQEEIMLAIVKYMMYLGIAASIIVAVYAVFIHVSVLLIMTFAVIFLMGAVPVALPAVLTIVQAATGMKLAEEGVLVTRLDSIEDAASISILCLDKTGTITQNKLSVIESISFSGFTKEDVVSVANLASRSEGMDLIDTAIIEYAKNIGVNHSSHKQIDYTPFNPAIRRTEAVIEYDGTKYKVVKGAAQVIVPMCKGIEKNVLDLVDSTIDKLSQKGYRTIAVAKSEDGNFDNLKFVGLLPLADPPRPDSKTMIEEAKKLGVKAIMLTGDNISIAKEVAQQVGLGDKIIKLKDIEGLSADEQIKIVNEISGFAEIYPEDKYKIVKLLQSEGFLVGMTGDGVNDAPALKQAEMGIAVSNATDVAKASASVVLTNSGVSEIVEAIKRSRETYQRMLTWVINKVTKVIQVVGLLTVGFFMMDKMVLSLLGMSLLVFANDFVTMSLATDNVKHTDDPNKWNVKNITFASLIIGALLVVQGILAILIGKNYFQMDLKELQAFMMLTLVFTSQFRVLIVRERNFFWYSLPGKALMTSSFVSVIVFIFLGIYGIFIPALTLTQVMVSLIFSAAFTLVIDIPKYYSFKLFGL
ncbi:MAG: plasma-membrane proton-efflux P-type ATPase [Bacteroidetes bacterium]|nr:plasma-membrane proton-efflux P-type ATPase [Bacteroidota bacterium]